MINKKISPETEQVLIGSLLGDGSLKVEKNGINAYFRELHNIKQRDYLVWKKGYLNCFSPKIKKGRIFDNRTNKYYLNILLWTKTHPILTEYFKLLYIKNKKIIRKDILNKVGPLALAVWYCDDGSFGYINQNGKIATYLPYKENILVTDFLKEKFDIKCNVNKDGKKHHLYFSVKEIKKFLNLIKDYVPKCMNYKLGPLSKENTKRLKEENLRRRQRDKIRYIRSMKDPIKRELIRKQHRENQRKRLQNPEYRRKYNEYWKIKQREYRKRKSKAVFLDRDGVLNYDPGYVHKIEDFKLIPKVIDGLRLLKDFKLMIITSQSGIGRGYFSEDNFLKFNSHLINELSKNKIKIEKTYYCPHKPDDNCDCRKPKTKLLEDAQKEFNIDLKNSFVIGDHPHDIEMGKKANCKTIFVLTGHGNEHKNELKKKPDFIAQDLFDAAQFILKNQPPTAKAVGMKG